MPTVLIALAHISFLLCAGMIVVVALTCERSQVRTAFLIALSVMSLWIAGTLLELDFRSLTGSTFMPFINVCYVGICLMPVAVLYLGRVILGSDWHPKKIHAAFLIVPVISIAVVFTNPLHHLFFVDFSLNSAEAVYGPYYYFHSVYSYGCIAAGIILMFIAAVENSGLFSMQSLFVILGVAVTLTLNVLYSFGIMDLPFSVNAASFSISILCFAVAFLKYRFITALPITLRQVIDLISDGYLVVDGGHGIIVRNRALSKMLGEPDGVTLGSDLRSFMEKYFDDISFDDFLKLQEKAVAGRETLVIEGRLKNGVFASLEITPVVQRNGHIGSIILIKDISQSKLLLEAAKAESRFKSDFLSNMSHEIRTPMSAIIGMVNIGISAADMERKDYCLTRIEDASKHLLGVVNDILDVSKIEAGKFELSPERFIFDRMIHRVVNVVKFRSDEKGQKFTVEIGERIPKVLFGDSQRLAQVITNLTGNAVKFTPEGGSVSLAAELSGETGGVCTLLFKVSDSGIGMNDEQRSRLFQHYSQAGADTSRKFGGTGLGLSISKSIVEMMGGKIWAESEPGAGSVFSFTIKMERGEGDGDADTDVRADGSRPHDVNIYDEIDGRFAGLKILLAEDVEVNREIVVALLGPAGFTIDCAENGAEAVRMFVHSPERYDMIFMDVQMPEMDGYEATRRIRALDITRAGAVPIIAMTANVFREDIVRCLEAGMDDHIGKPLDVGEIYARLKKYLPDDKPAAAVEAPSREKRRRSPDRRRMADRRIGERRKTGEGNK